MKKDVRHINYQWLGKVIKALHQRAKEQGVKLEESCRRHFNFYALADEIGMDRGLITKYYNLGLLPIPKHGNELDYASDRWYQKALEKGGGRG